MTSLSSATGLQHVELQGNTGIKGPLDADDATALCDIVQVMLCVIMMPTESGSLPVVPVKRSVISHDRIQQACEQDVHLIRT